MHIKIQPQDDEEATLKLASNVRHLATADVPAPKVSAFASPTTNKKQQTENKRSVCAVERHIGSLQAGTAITKHTFPLHCGERSKKVVHLYKG